VPEAANWVARLEFPDFHRILAAVDELSFDTLTTSEHLAMPYHEVPRLGPYWMDAMSVMAFVAGATKKIRIDTSVLVIPYHHPLPFAKAISTIDVLSGGRVDVSVGVGHAEQEFAVLGVSFADRGAITDETLDAAQVLWTEDEPVYHGTHFNIEGLAFEPKPVQTPRPPVYVGGNSKPALRRAARFEGWQSNPTNLSIEQMPEQMDYIRSQPEFAGKEDTFDFGWVGTLAGVGKPQFAALGESERRSYRDQIVDGIGKLTALGVTSVSSPMATTQSLDEYLDFVSWFSLEVIDGGS
jgi:probable F420-dependent oxidoreductase